MWGKGRKECLLRRTCWRPRRFRRGRVPSRKKEAYKGREVTCGLCSFKWGKGVGGKQPRLPATGFFLLHGGGSNINNKRDENEGFSRERSGEKVRSVAASKKKCTSPFVRRIASFRGKKGARKRKEGRFPLITHLDKEGSSLLRFPEKGPFHSCRGVEGGTPAKEGKKAVSCLDKETYPSCGRHLAFGILKGGGVGG